MKKDKEIKLNSECTTILVGKGMTKDGSFIISRSEDWDAMKSKRFEIYHDTNFGPTEFIALDSPFRCELPKKALGYTALPSYDLPGHWGSAGYNSVGVGMSATESIFSNDNALKVDPLIENGVAENSIFNIVLPYVKTAREAVMRTGELIEKYGAAECFGNSYVDANEMWYLEVACGHRWMATRIPDDVYFVSGNQSRFRVYDPKDKENYLGSKDLIEFAIANKLYNPEKGDFDFHEAYARDIELDTTYNYPRVCGLQAIFSPDIANDVNDNTFPVFAQAKHKLTVCDIKQALRFHYNGTEHDPYLNSNPNEPYRPVSIFRTTQTHIMQVRPNLPKEIGEINYVSMGMAAVSPFLPYYQGLTSYLPSYNKGEDFYSDDSAYWQYRKLQTLVMTNFNKYAPIVQKAYAEFEEMTSQYQAEMETAYLSIYKEQPLTAKGLIQSFSDKMMSDALALTKQLSDQLITELTKDIQEEYMFKGA